MIIIQPVRMRSAISLLPLEAIPLRTIVISEYDDIVRREILLF